MCVTGNECHEARGNPIASDAGASSRLYRFLQLRGVPFAVANTSVSGSQLKGRSRLKISMSDELIGMVPRLLRVFGGPNSPSEYVSATPNMPCNKSMRFHRFVWSTMSLYLEVAGEVLVAIGFLIVFLVYKENTFTSATNELAPEQNVMSTGLSALVGHPM